MFGGILNEDFLGDDVGAFFSLGFCQGSNVG
jgi:hypothetical protein